MHSEYQPFNFHAPASADGVVAQLGERSVRNAEVEGSIPFNSTAVSAAMKIWPLNGLPAAAGMA